LILCFVRLSSMKRKIFAPKAEGSYADSAPPIQLRPGFGVRRSRCRRTLEV
jgi:hypothetical protein